MSHNSLPILALLTTLLAGCFNPADLVKKSSEPTENAAATPENPAETPMAPDRAGNRIGDVVGVDVSGQADPEFRQNPAPAANPAAAPAPVPVDVAKLSWRLVDKQKIMAENPQMIVKSTAKLGGQSQDYLTAVSQAYVSARTRIYVMTLQHDLALQKELNDGKFPSFEQFEKMLKQSSVELANSYPWEVYAYDSVAGEIQLLEDPIQKRKIRQEKGLPVD